MIDLSDSLHWLGLAFGVNRHSPHVAKSLFNICRSFDHFSCCASHQSTRWPYVTSIFVPLVSRLAWSVCHWLASGRRSILVVRGRRVLGRSSATPVFIALTHGVSVSAACSLHCHTTQSLVRGGAVSCRARDSGQSLSLQQGLSKMDELIDFCWTAFGCVWWVPVWVVPAAPSRTERFIAGEKTSDDWDMKSFMTWRGLSHTTVSQQHKPTQRWLMWRW